MLTTEERDNLVKYKLERATETWKEIVGIVEGGYWYAAANRMYYACYYVTSALLVKNGIQANTHSGVIRISFCKHRHHFKRNGQFLYPFVRIEANWRLRRVERNQGI